MIQCRITSVVIIPFTLLLGFLKAGIRPFRANLDSVVTSLTLLILFSSFYAKLTSAFSDLISLESYGRLKILSSFEDLVKLQKATFRSLYDPIL